MKKIYLLPIMLLALMAVGFTSCGEEDDIFDRSAALRMNDYQDLVQETLVKNGGKWELDYFSTGSEQGVVFVMTFAENGTVEISSSNAWQTTFATDNSSWEVLTDFGVVLSFISYNNVFHRFSDPQGDVSDGYSAGKGHEGDYEFVVQNVTDDEITLVGKKRRIKMRLRRLPADTNDEELFNQLAATKAAIFSAKMPTQILELSDGSRYTFTGGNSEIVDLVPEGGDAVSQTVTHNIIVTPDGFSFMEAFKGGANGDIAVKDFVLQEDGSLLCSNDNASKLISQPLTTLFVSDTYTWQVQADGLGGQFATSYSATKTEVEAKRRKLNSVDFLLDADHTGTIHYINPNISNADTRFYVDMNTTGDDKVTIALTGDVNNNATTMVKNFPSLQELVDLFGGSFTLSAESAALPLVIKVTSDATPSNYFYIKIR